jgi:hypothetical protein
MVYSLRSTVYCHDLQYLWMPRRERALHGYTETKTHTERARPDVSEHLASKYYLSMLPPAPVAGSLAYHFGSEIEVEMDGWTDGRSIDLWAYGVGYSRTLTRARDTSSVTWRSGSQRLPVYTYT